MRLPWSRLPRILLLRYQDLKCDLAAFQGWEVTPEQKARVLEYSSFDWMNPGAPVFWASVIERDKGAQILVEEIADWPLSRFTGKGICHSSHQYP